MRLTDLSSVWPVRTNALSSCAGLAHPISWPVMSIPDCIDAHLDGAGAVSVPVLPYAAAALGARRQGQGRDPWSAMSGFRLNPRPAWSSADAVGERLPSAWCRSGWSRWHAP